MIAAHLETTPGRAQDPSFYPNNKQITEGGTLTLSRCSSFKRKQVEIIVEVTQTDVKVAAAEVEYW